MKIKFLSLILVTVFMSCAPSQEKLISIIRNNNVSELETVLSRNNMKPENYSVGEIFSAAMQNEKSVQLLIKSGLFKAVQSDGGIISSIINSNCTYSVKRSVIVFGTSPDLLINYNNKSMPVAYWLLSFGMSQDISLLMEKGMDLNSDNYPEPLIFTLVDKFEYEDIKDLIPQFNDLNIKNSDNETALYEALINSKPEIAKLMLNNGAKPELISSENPWFTLMRNWRNQPVYLELANDFNISVSISQNSAEAFKGLLFSRFLSDDSKIDVLKEMIELGFNRNDTDEDGLTPYDFLWYEYDSGPSIEFVPQDQILQKRKWKNEIGLLLEDS